MALRIDRFQPTEGWPGTIVVLEGDGFSRLRDDNEVFIGGDRALIIEASTTQLRVLAGEKTVSGAVEVVAGATRVSGPGIFRVLPAPDVMNPRVAGPPAFFHGPQHGTPAVGVADQPVLFIFAVPSDQPVAAGSTARADSINNTINPAMKFWKEATYGQTSWAATMTDWLPIPDTHPFYIWSQADIDEARSAYMRETRRCAAAGFRELFAGTQAGLLHIATRAGLPVIHSASGNPVTGVAADASNLYVVSGTSGLRVYEPPRPDNSIVDAFSTAPGAWFHDVDVSGSILAVAALDQGTWIWQLATGRDPLLVAVIAIARPSQWATAVQVSGTRLFVAEGQWLRVYDLTDPKAPAFTAKNEIDCGQWIMEIDFDAATNVCAVATDGNGMVIVDVSVTPPKIRGKSLIATHLHSVHMIGKRVFAAAGSDGLLIYDVTDTALPKVIGRLETREEAYHVIAGTGSAIVSIGSRVLAEVDISDPANPSVSDEWELFGPAPADLPELREAVDLSVKQFSKAKRPDALFHDAVIAARDAGHDIDSFTGIAVLVNGPEVRAGSSHDVTQFRHEETGDTVKLNESKGIFYGAINEKMGTVAHEIGHWLELPDLYQERFNDGSVIVGNIESWSIMADSQSTALYTAQEIQERLGVYRTAAPNPNLVERVWSPTDPPIDETFDIIAHDAAEDGGPDFIHILKLRVAEGLVYYVEVRHMKAGLTFDQTIPVPAVMPPVPGVVLITRSTSQMSISNTNERPVMLMGALNQVGQQVVDAARRLTITVDSILQPDPLAFRIRVQWNQPIAGDPNGQFDMTITPWNTDDWETVDIFVDSPRNNTGIFENHEPGDEKKAILNGDRPWVKRQNQIIARIRNTGPAEVPDVWVSFYATSPPGIGDNGNWSVIDTKHLTKFPAFDPNVAGSGQQLVACDWYPAADQHTCLKVAILPQIGEIEPNNNQAQENVFTFDSPGSSSHDPVSLAARVRSPFTILKKVTSVVRGLPMGWHVVVDHAWVWTGPKGEHDLTATIWTDLDAPYDSGPALTQEEKLRIPKRALARIEGWTDMLDRHLPIGGILADVKANKRVSGKFTLGMEGDELAGKGQLTPALPDIPICIEVIDATGNRTYLYAKSDASGQFDFRNFGKPLKLGAGRYVVQAFISGNDAAAETEMPVVTLDVT